MYNSRGRWEQDVVHIIHVPYTPTTHFYTFKNRGRGGGGGGQDGSGFNYELKFIVNFWPFFVLFGGQKCVGHSLIMSPIYVFF